MFFFLDKARISVVSRPSKYMFLGLELLILYFNIGLSVIWNARNFFFYFDFSLLLNSEFARLGHDAKYEIVFLFPLVLT